MASKTPFTWKDIQIAGAKEMVDGQGNRYYRIRYHAGAGQPTRSESWHPDPSWSAQAVDKALRLEVAAFQEKCRCGGVQTRGERKAARAEKERLEMLRPSVEKFVLAFLEERENDPTVSPRTAYNQRALLEKFVLPIIGDLKIADVQPEDIELVLKKYSDTHKASSTNTLRQVLSRVFSAAVRRRKIESNPVALVSTQKESRSVLQRSEPKCFTPEQLRDILNRSEDEPLKWRCVLNIFIDTGVRCAELCGLQWSDIDFSVNRVMVCRTANYSASGVSSVSIGIPKNGHARTVNICDSTAALLKEYRTESHRDGIPLTDDWVFKRRGGTNLPVSPNSIQRHFAAWAEAWGYDDLHPHLFRHSFATNALEAGVPATDVAALLGHSTVSTTFNFYSHSTDKAKRSAADTVHNLVRNAG